MDIDNKTQIIYLSHGGGPLPILGDPGHQAMVDFMVELPNQLTRPDAILVISAHWEEPIATVMNAAHPPMFYDYYGFPPAAYEITYPAPGSPEMAGQISEKLSQAGIDNRVDDQRGFDHGLFIPLKLMYPEADIPVLQLSLFSTLTPDSHLALGQALQKLTDQSLLVIGSGFSFHNMAAFFHHDPAKISLQNDAFQDWLVETITGNLTNKERAERLIAWESAPHARYCHPREEHLLPLHVCTGMAGEPGNLIFDDRIMGIRATAFLW